MERSGRGAAWGTVNKLMVLCLYEYRVAKYCALDVMIMGFFPFILRSKLCLGPLYQELLAPFFHQKIPHDTQTCCTEQQHHPTPYLNRQEVDSVSIHFTQSRQRSGNRCSDQKTNTGEYPSLPKPRSQQIGITADLGKDRCRKSDKCAREKAWTDISRNHSRASERVYRRDCRIP